MTKDFLDRVKSAARIEDVVSKRIALKKNGANLVACCPFHDEKTPSFTVSPSKNIFSCFGSCDIKGGDCIQFVEKYDHVNFKEAVLILAAEYGIPIEEAPREYKRPVLRDISGLSQPMLDWFKSRGISSATLQRMKVSEITTYVPQTEKKERCIAFNYFRDGELVNVKYRAKNKNFFLEAGAELIFYGLDMIKESEFATICEGEMDVLSLYEIGLYDAVSVPNGASLGKGSIPYLDNCLEYFEKKKEILLATDNDEPGLLLREELARRLGKDRCFMIDYPSDCKDANDVLMKHGKIALVECFEKRRPYPLEGITLISDVSKEINQIYTYGYPESDKIGYPLFDGLMSFSQSQLTIISGVPNQGKGEFLDQIMIRLAVRKGWKFGVMSAENQPVQFHFAKLAEKLMSKPFFHHEYKMSPSELQVAHDFINKHFFFVSMKEIDLTLDAILAKAQELVKRKGINGFIVDPFNRIEHSRPNGMTENDYIGESLTKIYKFKEMTGLHFIVVAHPRKIEKLKDALGYKVPTLYDINGSANWFNKSDNGIVVYRNFNTKRTEVHVQKVRWKWMGSVGVSEFDYDFSTGRYKEIAQMDFEKEL